MTTDQRLVLDLTEILAIRIECAKCGTAVSIKPEAWERQPFQCPGCSERWALPYPDMAPPLERVGVALRLLLQQITEAKPGPLPWRVRLEVERPTG